VETLIIVLVIYKSLIDAGYSHGTASFSGRAKLASVAQTETDNTISDIDTFV
jgi:hypothetical protein